MKKLGTRGMLIGALLVAISVVLARFVGFMLPGGAIRISFTNVPIILGGMFLGPIGGFIVGAVSDIIGAILFPQGTFFPGFVLSSGLVGLIPGLIMKSEKDFTITRVVIANIIIFAIVSIGLNTFWLSILLKKGFLALFPGRLIASGILTFINTFFVYIIAKRVKL
ncbi:MAG: folate family ECF transporter S component [Filifactoraceae bacterium]